MCIFSLSLLVLGCAALMRNKVYKVYRYRNTVHGLSVFRLITRKEAIERCRNAIE